VLFVALAGQNLEFPTEQKRNEALLSVLPNEDTGLTHKELGALFGLISRVTPCLLKAEAGKVPAYLSLTARRMP
jgi:hypothetical protein